ncbi:MAG: hypothetical protein IRZ14_19665 [Chloroflexi bacterium]|nr:hypothetical protein [Chloroflexota bacterium]
MTEAGRSEAKPCIATRQDGQPCRSFALPGSAYCYTHDPARAAERIEARRRGGQHTSKAHRFRALLPPRLVPVFERLEQAMESVEQGSISPSQAQALAALARAMVAVLESSELAERLKEIETMLEGRDGRA